MKLACLYMVSSILMSLSTQGLGFHVASLRGAFQCISGCPLSLNVTCMLHTCISSIVRSTRSGVRHMSCNAHATHVTRSNVCNDIVDSIATCKRYLNRMTRRTSRYCYIKWGQKSLRSVRSTAALSEIAIQATPPHLSRPLFRISILAMIGRTASV